MNKTELLELQKNIEEAKKEVSRLEGRRDNLLQQLQDDWECETVEQAKEKQTKLKESIEKLEKKITAGVKKLEKQHKEEVKFIQKEFELLR